MQFIRVMYSKLLTNSKQQPAFPLEASEVGVESVTTLPPWPLSIFVRRWPDALTAIREQHSVSHGKLL